MMPFETPMGLGDVCNDYCHMVTKTGLEAGFVAGVLITTIIFLCISLARKKEIRHEL